MKQILASIEKELKSYSLASDTLRMIAAAVLAVVTRVAFWILFIDVLEWIPEESITRPVTYFVWYFLFCVYYFGLCQFAFGSQNSDELRVSLSKTRPAESNPFLAFISGESGTSHATMFSIAALLGVGIVVFGFGQNLSQAQETALQVSALLAVLGSWISNVASFALQYARDDSTDEDRGFRFPDGATPNWADYLYTAVMVSATLSTADVAVVTRSRRKMVMVNTIIAFTFNTVIIAMLIAAIL